MNTLAGRFAALQDQGARANQEDDYGMMDGRDPGANGCEHTLLVLADGMGGHSAGEVASKLATEAIIEAYQTDAGPVSDQLRASVDVANMQLGAAAASTGKQGMGCTVVAAVISKRGLEWISIGDSPMWMFSKGVLRRLNADHSMAPVLANLVETGYLDAEEAASDPRRHALRSAVTGDEIDLIDQSSQPVAIGKKDVLLLASDGLQTLSEEELVCLLEKQTHETLQTLAEQMLAAVKEKRKPDQDNVTLLLYRPDGDYGVVGVVPPSATSSEKASPKNLYDHEADTRPSTARGTAATAKWRMYTRYAVSVALIIALTAAYYYWPADEHKASEAAPPPQAEQEAEQTLPAAAHPPEQP